MQETPLFTLDRDVFLAAISVIPAAILYIVGEHLFLGIALGTAIFLMAEYGYPAVRDGRIDLTPAFRLATQVRETVRSRVIRKA